jgi:hypothetical protein
MSTLREIEHLENLDEPQCNLHELEPDASPVRLLVHPAYDGHSTRRGTGRGEPA